MQGNMNYVASEPEPRNSSFCMHKSFILQREKIAIDLLNCIKYMCSFGTFLYSPTTTK